MTQCASFTRMQNSTQADWRLSGGEFKTFARGLPLRDTLGAYNPIDIAAAMPKKESA